MRPGRGSPRRTARATIGITRLVGAVTIAGAVLLGCAAESRRPRNRQDPTGSGPRSAMPTPGERRVVIPDLSGIPLGEAFDRLRSLQIRRIEALDYDANHRVRGHDTWVVVNQSPLPGTPVPSTQYVFVWARPPVAV